MKELFIKRNFASLYNISPRELEKLKKRDVEGLMLIEHLLAEKQKTTQTGQTDSHFKGVQYK